MLQALMQTNVYKEITGTYISVADPEIFPVSRSGIIAPDPDFKKNERADK